jgi:hypothetical protein
MSQVLSNIMTGVILLGLTMFCLGLLIWVFGLLARYHVPWEIQLAALGILLLIFGVIAAKLLSGD